MFQNHSGSSVGSAFLLIILGAFTSVPRTFGQGEAAQLNTPPSISAGAKLRDFDVVSIEPIKDFDGTGYNYSPNGYWAKALPVSSSIEEAYGVYESYRIVGLPDWARSQLYNINAKVDDANLAEYQRYTHDQRKVMIQSFLAERLKLKTHFETKNMAVYLLKVSSKAPKFSESSNASEDSAADLDCLAKGTGKVGYLPLEHCSMSGFAGFLTQIVGYQVINQTGLTGKYDFELTWNPRLSESTVDSGQDETKGTLSIFSALQSELGLKLQSSKAPVSILVIDHIEMPSPN